jgi:hypothetical protein
MIVLTEIKLEGRVERRGWARNLEGGPIAISEAAVSSAPIPAVRCATIEPPEWTPLDLHDRAA